MLLAMQCTPQGAYQLLSLMYCSPSHLALCTTIRTRCPLLAPILSMIATFNPYHHHHHHLSLPSPPGGAAAAPATSLSAPATPMQPAKAGHAGVGSAGAAAEPSAGADAALPPHLAALMGNSNSNASSMYQHLYNSNPSSVYQHLYSSTPGSVHQPLHSNSNQASSSKSSCSRAVALPRPDNSQLQLSAAELLALKRDPLRCLQVLRGVSGAVTQHDALQGSSAVTLHDVLVQGDGGAVTPHGAPAPARDQERSPHCVPTKAAEAADVQKLVR